MGDDSKFTYIMLAVILAPLLVVIVLAVQEPKHLEGVVDSKSHTERKCTMSLKYDPALNISTPVHDCKGPYWSVVIDGKKYNTSQEVYNLLNPNSKYRFSYNPILGLTVEN